MPTCRECAESDGLGGQTARTKSAYLRNLEKLTPTDSSALNEEVIRKTSANWLWVLMDHRLGAE